MAPARQQSGDFSGEPSLAAVDELIGPDGALALAEAFGGRRIYLPKAPGQHHPLSVVVGAKAALIIGQVMGGLYLAVPLSPSRRAQILALKAAGKGPIEIRRIMKCSRSLVFKVLQEAREAPEPEPRLL